MSANHSFTEYVANTFDNQFWVAAEEFLRENVDDLNIELYKIHRAGETEIQEVNVEHVWIDDLPGMEIQFDVALSVVFEIHEADYHYDETEEKKIWMMVRCRGDLAQGLEDFEIFEVSDYKGKNRARKPMDDALVPVINKDNLEKVAEQFLRDHYKKALLEPVWVDPSELAKSMGLTVQMVHITRDGSVFGRSFFYDCETELYDPDADSIVKERILAGTILVDKTVAFMRVLGATNNTIVHECVHWDKHKKAFALAKLHNKELTNIGCEVTGGIVENKDKRDAVDWMEWQANSLAPRIQMPLGMFKKRAEQLVSKYRRELHEFDMIDIIEPIIDELSVTFCVSRIAAKIRMIDAGYEEAMGAFIYLDGKYVKPHKARTGYLEKNKTFSIGATDAAILSLTNPQLQAVCASGQYQYVDSHFVINHSLYVEQDENGIVQLTHYARNHMDECCLVFELSINNHYGERYHSECFLNRDEASSVDFNVGFHDGYENAPPERQAKLLMETLAEETRVYEQLPNSFTAALKMAIDWRNEQIKEIKKNHPTREMDKITAVEIANRTGLNEATVRRTLNDGDTSTNSLVLICLALHLPYNISKHILDHSPAPLRMNNDNHRWYNFALQHLYPKTVEEVKKILQEYGADPL